MPISDNPSRGVHTLEDTTDAHLLRSQSGERVLHLLVGVDRDLHRHVGVVDCVGFLVGHLGLGELVQGQGLREEVQG